jgi:hypothetical protein
MFWFLLVCTSVHNGSQCLPLQKMPSQRVCEFVARHYREQAHYIGDVEPHVKCISY